MNKDIYTALLVNAWYTAQSLHFAQHGSLDDDDKERLFIDIFEQTHRLQALTGNEAGFAALDKEGIREAVRLMIGIGRRP